MTPAKYTSTVEMLIKATQSEKLIWEDNDGDFSTIIDGCSLLIRSSYDFSVNISTYTLKMFNKNGAEFESFSYSENIDIHEYQQLNRLYNVIRDKYYRITESENTILQNLEKMTESPLLETNNLPF